MKSQRHVCFHFRLIWLPLLYTYLLATLSYADHLLGNQDFDESDDNTVSGRRWSFYRQHRYDIKKPGPTYFFHEPDSNEFKDIQLKNDNDPIRSTGYTEGVVQWLPMDETIPTIDVNNDNNGQVSLDTLDNDNIQLAASMLLADEPRELETIVASNDDLSQPRPLLALLEDYARLLSSPSDDQDERLPTQDLDDNLNVNVNNQFDPNIVWSAYQDNQFEVNEPLATYFSSLPTANGYLPSRQESDSDSYVNRRPIFTQDNSISQWSLVPDESGSNHIVDSSIVLQDDQQSTDKTDGQPVMKENSDAQLKSNNLNPQQANINILPIQSQDGVESSLNDDSDQLEAKLSSVPDKLIVPKELNLIIDKPELKVKRYIKTSSVNLSSLESSSSQSLTVLTVSLCLTVFVALIAGLVLFVIKRNQNLRTKLRTLIGSIGSAEEGAEVTSDYEDLCRQRMQSKNCKKSDKEDSKCSSTSSSFSSDAKSKTGLVGSSRTTGTNKEQTKNGESKSIDSGPEPSPPSRSSTSSWSEEPITSNLDISTGHMILSYMEDHLKNKDRLAKEWEALCAYEVDPCSTTAALLPANGSKNRYPDVLPFDHSRVILNDLANPNRSDYINASTITDHDPRSPVYIVTQGPLPSTVADFWQMIWEQGSVIIVMLSRLQENSVSCSARYWPEEGSALHANFEVHLVSEHIWCDDYLVRSFFLKNIKTNETRTVTQFHYLSWSENGVPPNPRSLLEFRRKVNKSYRGRSCPIVVHCSDGIGRTGTYCLIDMVLNRLAKGAKEIDIAATLEHIRDQRGSSVKTKAQFEFVLEAIAEEVSAILKTLKPN